MIECVIKGVRVWWMKNACEVGVIERVCER